MHGPMKVKFISDQLILLWKIYLVPQSQF